jgi:hypothetical protein
MKSRRFILQFILLILLVMTLKPATCWPVPCWTRNDGTVCGVCWPPAEGQR